MKDTGRRITLTEAVQLYRKMQPACGLDAQPEKIDVFAIDWPFPFGKMWRDGRFVLGVAVCPATGYAITPGFIIAMHKKYPEQIEQIDKVVSDWDNKEPFFDYIDRHFKFRES